MSRLGESSGSEKSMTEQVKGKVSDIGQSVREAGSRAKDVAQEQIGQLRDSAAEYYQQGREKVSEYYQQGRDKAAEWEHDLEGYIREEPLKSVLIAAGVGLLLGFLWRRR